MLTERMDGVMENFSFASLAKLGKPIVEPRVIA